ncbi:hypothetical protein MRX96_012179 [Rhipicephalus microplus]
MLMVGGTTSRCRQRKSLIRYRVDPGPTGRTKGRSRPGPNIPHAHPQWLPPGIPAVATYSAAADEDDHSRIRGDETGGKRHAAKVRGMKERRRLGGSFHCSIKKV